LTKIEEILTIDLSFPDIETEMEIFDNISSTRRCLALQTNTHVVTDCSEVRVSQSSIFGVVVCSSFSVFVFHFRLTIVLTICPFSNYCF
jgi:hypothetical protein